MQEAFQVLILVVVLAIAPYSLARHKTNSSRRPGSQMGSRNQHRSGDT
jgi:hypothetical protein